MMQAELEKKCQQLNGSDADTLCDILLTQRVTDEYFDRVIMDGALTLKHQRKMFKLRSWFNQQSGANVWQKEIQSIQDVIVQNTRNVHNQLEHRVAIFLDRSTNVTTSGYLLLSTLDELPRANTFQAWIFQNLTRLIHEYEKLK